MAAPHGAPLTPLRTRLDELATDIGRLRRRAQANADELGLHYADRLAAHVEALHTLLEPTAAELAQQTYPGDPETISLAIAEVDARARRLHERLGA